MAEYCEIKIKGYLDQRWQVTFSPLQLTHLDGEITLLAGSLPDQTALYGMLEQIRDFNLTLISVVCSVQSAIYLDLNPGKPNGESKDSL